jgi:hypothetical protein
MLLRQIVGRAVELLPGEEERYEVWPVVVWLLGGHVGRRTQRAINAKVSPSGRACTIRRTGCTLDINMMTKHQQ